MRKSGKISENKKVKIISNSILHQVENGKYFPIRIAKPSNNIPLVRLSILPEFYHSFFEDLVKNPNWPDFILSGAKIRKVSDLDSRRLVYSGIDSEFFWAKYVVAINRTYINKYLSLSTDYSNKLVKGEYDAAAEILDEIESNFGCSVWLIKNKIAFLQITQGLEAQKIYTQNIKNDLREGGLIKFLTHWLSVRNEPQTSVGRFSSDIESIVNSFNHDRQAGYSEYSRFHLLGQEPMDKDGFAQILRLSYSTSIIDYYEAFVATLQNFAIDGTEKYAGKTSNFLLASIRKINDKRFPLLNRLVKVDTESSQLFSAGIKSYEMFLGGNFEAAFQQASEDLRENPSNVLCILSKAHSNAMRKDFNESLEDSLEGSFLNLPLGEVIVDGITKILKNGIEGSTEEFNNLSKLAMNFSVFPWATAILLTLEREKTSFKEIDRNFNLIVTKDIDLNPFVIDLISNTQLANLYGELCASTYPDSIAVNYHTVLQTSQKELISPRISPIHSDYACAEASFNTKDYTNTILYAKKLTNCTYGFFERRGFGLEIRAYLNISDLIMACITVADSYTYNRSYYPFLPLEQLAQLIKPGTSNWKKVNALIDLSIVFDACVKHVDKSFEVARRFAYEDYLLKNGVEKPSELKVKLKEIAKNKLIYYLRYICIESTMDMSGAFEGGTSEVLAERLAVCRLLLDLDVVNEASYKQEINDLVRRQVILSRREEIDQSRIYVDIDSVKEWAQSELRENFGRYQAYLRHGVNASTVTNKSFDTLGVNQKDKLPIDNINVPRNEVVSLLGFMIEAIRSSYLSSDVGLDRFISTRIRHGELERNMRIPLQKHNLITKKQVRSGPYLRNDFWLDKMLGYPEANVNLLDKAFATFSESYDALISEIANDWLQILKPSKAQGLFDFTLFDTDFQRIYESIDKETSLKQFIDNVIIVLERKLIYTLLTIRDKLNKVARIQAKTLLNNLQEATITSSFLPVTELQSAISQARTDLQSQFDKIIGWFVPSSTGSSTPYEVEDAIWVAEATMKEENPRFQINVESDEFEISIHGQLPIFVDIFINIFENVVKRSGLDHPCANVKIWIDTVDDELTVIYCSVTNDLGSDIDVEALDIDLKRKKAMLDSGNYLQYLVTDKNSGLFKIYTSVRDFYLVEKAIEPSVDFGVVDRQFQITLSIPFKTFTLESVEQI